MWKVVQILTCAVFLILSIVPANAKSEVMQECRDGRPDTCQKTRTIKKDKTWRVWAGVAGSAFFEICAMNKGRVIVGMKIPGNQRMLNPELPSDVDDCIWSAPSELNITGKADSSEVTIKIWLPKN